MNTIHWYICNTFWIFYDKLCNEITGLKKNSTNTNKKISFKISCNRRHLGDSSDLA